jgi:outer membrane lipoprotein-sorting protein
MKKFAIVIIGLLAVFIVKAQSLDEVVKNYTAAMKTDKLASVKSIKITGKMSAMGMEMPMVMIMKNPNKIKITYSFNGQDMMSVFDGEKGYSINPMTGSSSPVELSGDQLKQIQNNNAFKNELLTYFKSGQLTLEGLENINEKPAFKLKATAGTSPIYMFIDKASYMLVKTSATVTQMGTSMNVDSYMTDYVDINGVVMPKKTTAMANGMEAAVITFDKIEVNIPVEDSVFKVK